VPAAKADKADRTGSADAPGCQNLPPRRAKPMVLASRSAQAGVRGDRGIAQSR
jgi:hypothetical protein